MSNLVEIGYEPFDINENWVLALQDLMNVNTTVSPRGMKTKEILGFQTVTDMSTSILSVSQRKMNYRFLFGEAAWILSGSNRVADIIPYMKAIKKFSDDGTFFKGAYGPKVIDQLMYVKETLKNDEDSRQALLNIWRENPGPSKDIPCTVSLQFIIRNGYVNCMATMRSSDIWLGWVYDTFNFSMIATWLTLALREETGNDYRLGNLYLTAGSQHIYEQHFDKAQKILDLYNGGEFIAYQLEHELNDNLEQMKSEDLVHALSAHGLETMKDAYDYNYFNQVHQFKSNK